MGEHASKKQMLRSTGILGLTQILVILVGIVRVKVVAILLGAVGVGVSGMYQATFDLVRSIAGFSLGSSAVRDIADGAANGNQHKLSSAIIVVRKWCMATGVLATLLAFVFSSQLSKMAFDTADYSLGIKVMSIALLFYSLAEGQGALLQGLRQVTQMAKAKIFGAVVGLIGSASVYYFWGQNGIVPAIVFTYVVMLVANWYYSSKIKVMPIRLSPSEIFNKGKAMVSLGFFFTVANFANIGTMYLVRSFVLKNGGFAAVGHFVAAWSISTMYLTAIITAMSSDYYPRLSGVQNNRRLVRNMVNEQTEVALLAAAPIIIGLIGFIDIVVRVFYSKDFSPTAKVLDWQLMGDFFKVLTYPVGFILLAKGKGRMFVMTEVIKHSTFCTLVYLCWRYWKLEATGIAFIVTQILYVFIILWSGRKLVGFRYSAKVLGHCMVFIPILLCCFLSVRYLNGNWRYFSCTLLTVLGASYSLFHIDRIVDVRTRIRALFSSRPAFTTNTKV